MYICNCNGINDKTIREAIGDEPEKATYVTIYKKLGHRPQCGKCFEHFNEFVAQLKQEKADRVKTGAKAAKKPAPPIAKLQ